MRKLLKFSLQSQRKLSHGWRCSRGAGRSGENAGEREEESEADGEGVVHQADCEKQQQLEEQGETLGHVPGMNLHCGTRGERRMDISHTILSSFCRGGDEY